MAIVDRIDSIFQERQRTVSLIEADCRRLAEEWHIQEILSEMKDLVVEELGGRLVGVSEIAAPLDLAGRPDEAGHYLELTLNYHPFSNLELSHDFYGIKSDGGRPKRYGLGVRDMETAEIHSIVGDVRELVILVVVRRELSASVDDQPRVTVAVRTGSEYDAYLVGGIPIPSGEVLELVLAKIWVDGLAEDFPVSGRRTKSSIQPLKRYLGQKIGSWTENRAAKRIGVFEVD